MTRFRPCIDLHAGHVKQIVGGTLSAKADELRTNHVSTHSAGHFAHLYRDNNLRGGHVIMLGPGNNAAAREALQAWPGALQVGGGIDAQNAAGWINAGAEKVIVTSYLFPNAKFSLERVRELCSALDGDVDRLVIDLSCRRQANHWVVAMNKWQTLTDTTINEEFIRLLEPFCSEFLIHAADNEGLQKGIDQDLVKKLGQWCSIPVTYAGGGKNLADLDLVRDLSRDRVDLTLGSALDIFGGSSVTLADCIAWNKAREIVSTKK